MMSVGPLRSAANTAALVIASITLCVSGSSAQTPSPGWDVPVASVPHLDQAERGWIGVGVDITVSDVTAGPAILVVRVVRTVDGAPAALVGIVPGDVIRTIDGDPITVERWQRFTQNLRPRVNLRLALDRAGRSVEVTLTTAPRPSVSPVPVVLTDHLDSVRTSFRTRLESGRGVWASQDYVSLLIASDAFEAASTRFLRQAEQNAASYGVRLAPLPDIPSPPGRGGNRYSVVWDTDAALPFEYLMLLSPEADSVKTAIIRLRGALTEVSDNGRVREDLERLAVRLAEIGSNERESRVRVAGVGAEIAARFRPATARVVGQNFVGGAQFNDLNPQLGEYFGTDHGVLVIQVLSGTPFDEAGLVPGDVVTQVGDTEIVSVEGFRTVLARAFAGGRRADLTLIRRGERVTATLSR